MRTPHSKSIQAAVAALSGIVLLSGLATVARADPDPHAQADTFAAEAAALLPVAAPPKAVSRTAPTRIGKSGTDEYDSSVAGLSTASVGSTAATAWRIAGSDGSGSLVVRTWSTADVPPHCAKGR